MDRDNILLKVKLRRTALGYSQDEVARAISMDRSQYSKVEKGLIDLNLEKLIKLMFFLDLKWSDLEATEALPATDTLEIAEMKKNLSDIMNRLSKIEKDGK